MTDISSISFSQQSISITPFTSRLPSIQLSSVFDQIRTSLQPIRDFNGQAKQLYQKMATLIKKTQQKVDQVKKQNWQAHIKCLQHIQILLFQKDYSEALSKIDRYKKLDLTDIQQQLQYKTAHLGKLSAQQLNFQQAKLLINNQFTDFDLKQQIWLQYALDKQQTSQNLRHVTNEQIQNAQLENFKKQFSIITQIAQVEQNQPHFTTTPEKKNSRSVGILKSEVKKHKNSNFALKNSHNQKSAGKLGSGNKRSSEKRTTRKKGNKQNQQNKTSKKVVTSFMV